MARARTGQVVAVAAVVIATVTVAVWIARRDGENPRAQNTSAGAGMAVGFASDGGERALDGTTDAGGTETADEAGSDDDLLKRLHETVDDDPRAAIGLAREAERLFADSPHADERSFLLMRALVHLGDIHAAREEAYRFYERFPSSPFAERVFRLTGLHPRPRPGPR